MAENGDEALLEDLEKRRRRREVKEEDIEKRRRRREEKEERVVSPNSEQYQTAEEQSIEAPRRRRRVKREEEGGGELGEGKEGEEGRGVLTRYKPFLFLSLKPKQEPVWSRKPSASSEQKKIHPGEFVSEPVTHEVGIIIKLLSNLPFTDTLN